MVEVEFSILARQCLGKRRIPDAETHNTQHTESPRRKEMGASIPLFAFKLPSLIYGLDGTIIQSSTVRVRDREVYCLKNPTQRVDS